MSISVEIRESQVCGELVREVEIYCDREGLDSFIFYLESLRKNGGHIHLKTPAWAGSELSEKLQGRDTILVNHVCLVSPIVK
jgi:hypothetical protein